MTSIHSVCLVSLTILIPPLTRGEDFARQGRELLAKKEYDKAIAAFTKAIEANPKNVESYLENWGHSGLTAENLIVPVFSHVFSFSRGVCHVANGGRGWPTALPKLFNVAV